MVLENINGRKSRLTKTVSENNLEQKLKNVKVFWRVQPILVILSLSKLPQTSIELAMQFHLSSILAEQ